MRQGLKIGWGLPGIRSHFAGACTGDMSLSIARHSILPGAPRDGLRPCWGVECPRGVFPGVSYPDSSCPVICSKNKLELSSLVFFKGQAMPFNIRRSQAGVLASEPTNQPVWLLLRSSTYIVPPDILSVDWHPCRDFTYIIVAGQ